MGKKIVQLELAAQKWHDRTIQEDVRLSEMIFNASPDNIFYGLIISRRFGALKKYASKTLMNGVSIASIAAKTGEYFVTATDFREMSQYFLSILRSASSNVFRLNSQFPCRIVYVVY